MYQVEKLLREIAIVLSRLLDPVLAGLDHLGSLIRRQFDQWGMPFQWQQPAVTALWVIALLLLLRAFDGWIRAVIVVVVAIFLLRAWGYIPGS